MVQTHLAETDARAMVRLVGGVAAIDGGHMEKKRYLMDGLCTLIDADAWVWSLGTRAAAYKHPSFSSFLHGGFDEQRFMQLLALIEHEKIGAMAGPFYNAIGTDDSLTMSRQEIDAEGASDTPELQCFWKAANVRSLLMSGHPLDAGSMSTIAIYRKYDDAPFDEREKRIAHIILTEVPWLHLSGWPEDRGVTVPRLFPRQRIVLNLLLDGLSRKAIAKQMEITESTVAGYTKDIYKHFGVKSQVELVRKFYT